MLMTLASGCATVISESASCDATKKMKADHAKALVIDGGDLSVTTGKRLISALDAGCFVSSTN